MPIDWSKYEDDPAPKSKKMDWSKYEAKESEPDVDEMMQHALGMSYGAGSLNKALSNLPSSAANLAGGYINALSHPVDSAKALGDIVGGGLGKVLPESLRTENPERDIRQELAFDQFIDRFSHRLKNPKETFENDPLGMIADYSMLLSPLNPRLATKIDPMTLAAKGVGKAIPAAGSLAAEIIGGIGTRTGGETLREAARAGMAGGQKADDFLDNLNGNVPMTDVVAVAKKGQQALRDNSFQKYLDETAGPFGDLTSLDIGKIKNAVARSNAMDVHQGIDINPGAAGVKQSVSDLVGEFDSAGLNTIKDFDALKRGVGNVMKNTDKSKTEYRAAKNVYDALRDEINIQDPRYANAMKNSENSLSLLSELDRELSLNPKANIGTTLRKLQSSTRNNANTSYGQRVSLVNELENAGADNLNAMLAGQALNTWSPRGLGTITQGGTLGAGALTGNLPAAVGVAALQSPKLMGLLSYGAGKGAGTAMSAKTSLFDVADTLGISPEILANYLYHAQSE